MRTDGYLAEIQSSSRGVVGTVGMKGNTVPGGYRFWDYSATRSMLQGGDSVSYCQAQIPHTQGGGLVPYLQALISHTQGGGPVTYVQALIPHM